MDTFPHLTKKEYYTQRRTEIINSPKPKKIKNKLYRQFLDTNIINTLSEDEIIKVVNNLDHKEYRTMGRCIVIALYYTGARPVEVSEMTSSDFEMDEKYIYITLIGRKESKFKNKQTKPRVIKLRKKHLLARELYNYAVSMPPNTYIFWYFKGKYTRKVISKKGALYDRIDVSDRLRYYIKRWTACLGDERTVTPYFFRHNRMSKWAERGASDQDLRILKGCTTTQSVTPYVHMSKKRQDEMANITD